MDPFDSLGDLAVHRNAQADIAEDLAEVVAEKPGTLPYLLHLALWLEQTGELEHPMHLDIQLEA